MKAQYYLIMALLFFFIRTEAQNFPVGMKYQAVARDISGNTLASQRINLKITLFNKTPKQGKAISYVEFHETMTNELGLFALTIGQGKVETGAFEEIPWSSEEIWMAVDVDLKGGNNFTVISESQLLAVPYAIHAMSASELTGTEGETTLKSGFERHWSAFGNSEINPLIHFLGTTDYRDLIFRTNNFPRGGISADGDLFLLNNATIEQDLNVVNNSNVEGNATVGENLNVLQNADITGNLNVESNLTVVEYTKLYKGLEVLDESPTFLTGTLAVLGESKFNGLMHLNNGLTVHNESPTYLTGTLTVDSVTNLNDTLNVGGITNLNNALNVTGGNPTYLSGNLNVGGATGFEGDLTVDGATDLKGTLNVDGSTEMNNILTVTGGSTTNLTGAVNVDGATDLNSSLNVDGITNLNNTFTVTGGHVSNLTGALNVDGATDLNSSLNVDGITNLNNTFTVTGGHVSNHTGAVNVDGATDLNSSLNVDGITDLNNTLNVTGGNTSNLSGALNVDGATDLNSSLNVDGITNLNNTFTVTGGNASNLTGALNVNGVVTLNNTTESNAYYEGALIAKGGLGVAKNANIHGSLSVKGTGTLGPNGKHSAYIYNTSGQANACGLAIQINNGSTHQVNTVANNYVTFYNQNGSVAGRIEGFDLQQNGAFTTFPDVSFASFYNIASVDLSSFMQFNPATLTTDFFGGSTDFLFSLFDPATLSNTFSGGSLPINSPSIANAILSPPTTATPAFNAKLQELICWALDNGMHSLITTNPFDLAMAARIIAETQKCTDNGVIYGATGADYAEWLEKSDPEETFVAGQIVGIHGGKITKVTEGADQVLPVSLAPIVLGNMPPDEEKGLYEKVGFMGQVPVLIWGKANVGDFIIPSGKNDGFGLAVAPEDMKIDNMKYVVGRVWEEGTNERMNMVNSSIGLATNEWVEILKKQATQLEHLENRMTQLERMEAKIDLLSKNMEASAK